MLIPRSGAQIRACVAHSPTQIDVDDQPLLVAGQVAPVTTWLALALAPSDTLAKTKKKPAVAVRTDDSPDAVTYGQRADVMRFGAELAERRGLDVAWVQAALAESKYIPSVVKYIMPPPAGTAKNWALYRSRFIEPIRIRAGLAFWNANEAWLKVAEQRYEVIP